MDALRSRVFLKIRPTVPEMGAFCCISTARQEKTPKQMEEIRPPKIHEGSGDALPWGGGCRGFFLGAGQRVTLFLDLVLAPQMRSFCLKKEKEDGAAPTGCVLICTWRFDKEFVKFESGSRPRRPGTHLRPGPSRSCRHLQAPPQDL